LKSIFVQRFCKCIFNLLHDTPFYIDPFDLRALQYLFVAMARTKKVVKAVKAVKVARSNASKVTKPRCTRKPAALAKPGLPTSLVNQPPGQGVVVAGVPGETISLQDTVKGLAQQQKLLMDQQEALNKTLQTLVSSMGSSSVQPGQQQSAGQASGSADSPETSQSSAVAENITGNNMHNTNENHGSCTDSPTLNVQLDHVQLENCTSSSNKNLPDTVDTSSDSIPDPPTSAAIPNLFNIQTTIHRPIQAAGVPIGTNIKHSLKTQIWQHKFIDLADLLYPNRAQNYFLNFAVDKSSPSLSLAPRKSKPLSETEWSSAMDVFIAIFL
jgi:hypothetical protein